MICSNDGTEMVLRPAGVSARTNRAYSAFFACPNCRKTANAKSVQATPQIQSRDDSIKQAQDRKEDSISKFNAINAAINLVQLVGWIDKADEEKEEILQEIFRLQNAIYKHNRKRTGF
jgi:hypothetical protein